MSRGEILKRPVSGNPRYLFSAFVCFTIAAVVARGVRWDETWEHAQILSGAIVYPEGHPLALYVHNAFSLQTWLAGVLSGLGPATNCAFRNGLFLLASLVPVCALTAALSRSVLAGLAAAILHLQGILLEFDGSYPTMVWPELYSNGHIGGGVVLLALAALVAGWYRSAFFLAGFVPAIHVGQWPPLAAVVALFTVYLAIAGLSRPLPGTLPTLRLCLGWLLAGLGCTALFWVIHRHGVLPIPGSGPYAARAGAAAVWRGYTALHDPHRAFPPGNGHVVLAGTLAFCVLAASGNDRMGFRPGYFWLTVFCGAIAGAVWGIMAIHAWLGPDIPFLLIAWMPYRLINLIPPVTLAVTTAAVVLRWPDRGWWILASALAMGLLQPVWPHLVGLAFYKRYLAGGEFVAFALYGLGLFAAAPLRGRGRTIAVALAFVLVVTLALYHQFGAVCVVLGIAAGYALHRLESVRPRHAGTARRVAGLVSVVAAAALLLHQFHYRQNLPTSPFQSQVRDALAGKVALLGGPPDSILLQATTNQPVLAEAATPSLISYVPDIGPAIDQLYRDLYGYGFTIPESGAPAPRPWTEYWRSRSTADWQVLQATYGLTHVVSPADLVLPLEPVVSGSDYTLYAIVPPAASGH